MWNCTLCQTCVCPTLRELLRHIRIEHINEFPLYCGINNCHRTFQSYRAIYQHCSYNHGNHFAKYGQQGRFYFPLRNNAVIVQDPEGRPDDGHQGNVCLDVDNGGEGNNDVVMPEGNIEIRQEPDRQNENAVLLRGEIVEEGNAAQVAPIPVYDIGGIREQLANHITTMRRRFKMTQVQWYSCESGQ